MSEPNSQILMRIRNAHPGAQVTQMDDKKWRAEIPVGTGTRVVIRVKLTDVENRLNELNPR